MQIDIGIDETTRQDIALGVSGILADTYTLYLRAHRFHWNVTGPQFDTLHKVFEAHYNELWIAVDELAERIRTLGHFAPGTYSEFAALTALVEEPGTPAADGMIRSLVRGHETVIRRIRALLPRAQQADDESTAALLSDRLRVHEKTAWMLRSQLPTS
ncbi:MAG: DNA starvation/stationary phase protection protein [Proteobacteria bacterium]|nr:DNA starvation/stationary phase protection protein [Pseudomonadota bacterium]MCP4916743.1 DNA starvation/stationary phase protection protein [Pseudomonadota bacterium]